MMAATDELTLLERVFLRIGSAESDEQLQNAVSKFLLPVLLKLSSQQEGVRKKVMELLVHINKRIKCRPKIQLPVEALLLQYGDPAATSFVTNFTIIYIKMGFPRLDLDQQAGLIPSILNCIEGKPQSHQESVMLMMMPVFAHIKIPLDSQKCKNMYGLHEKPAITKLLLDLMLDVLLLPYGSLGVSSPKQPSVQVSVTVDAGTSGTTQATAVPAPPGLSESAYKRIMGENTMSPEELELTKLGIAKFLGGGFLQEEDVIVPLIIASSDTRHSVVNAAEMELKRLAGAINITNVGIINKLYAIFLGTVPSKNQKPPAKTEMMRTPANTRIRLKILPYLLKSREATLNFPACIQMVFDCLYGVNSNPKLKILAVQFVHHICLNCSEMKLAPIAPVLLSGMVKLIAEAKEDAKLRSLAYVAIGKLGNKLPQLVNKDLSLLQTFFDAMSEEDQDRRLAIQEALLIMSNAFRNLSPSNLNMMEALLTASMEKPEPQVRLLAVQYAAIVFPADHIPSRYLLLLAAGDMKEEVYSEAAKTLHTVPTKGKIPVEKQCKESTFPSFPELVKFIDEKAQERMKSRYKYVIGTNVLPFNPATCTEMLTYMRMCLAHSAGLEPNLLFSQHIQEQAPEISKYVRRLLSDKSGEKGAMQLYINFIKQFLTVISGSASMYYLLEMVAVAPEALAPTFAQQLDWIKNFMFSSKEDMRFNASQLYAIVVSHCLDGEAFSLIVKELSSYFVKDKTPEQQHGAIIALGHALGRKAMLKGKGILGTIEGVADAIKAIARFLESSQLLLLTAACQALGEIGRNGILPIPDEDTGEDACSKLSIVIKLTGIVKTTKYAAKIQEKAALAASYLCLGDAQFPHRCIVMEKLLECAGEVKDVDLHFTIGEALACAALCSASPAARDFWTVSEEEYSKGITNDKSNEKDELDWLLTQIFNKYVASLNPHVRQAACVWLLSLLKQCSKHDVIRAHLETLQKVFINLLSENNEITQDMASKGLGFIYECSEEDQKTKLLAILVDALMVGRRPTQQLTEDSKIFEEGTLGTAPHGGGLSTYKELCSLASDLNQPDLVYKFMHLANHNAIWNSKKGAAFGFSMIATKAGEQLQPYLPKIIPKLYRYQFDPNSKIQQSMTSIWQAIVPDSQKMVDQHVKEILADLKVNLTNNMWRTRESSCLALADVLRGRQLDDIVNDLPELWEICFRVRDDIKESVRLAAESSLKALSKVTIRLCDTSSGVLGQVAISSVLPVLLKSGLMSTVIEVRTISLATLSKIGKSAGALLKPHIPLLAVSLLESLSALEQQELNYLSVRLGNQQNTQEKLDNARIAAAKSSPMMETMNQCLPFIDEEVLVELIPRLIDLIKNSVGLGTKAGCAHFITSLTHYCPVDMLQPHTGRLLASLLHGLNDRSGAVRKSYALAIGRLVKSAKDSSVEKLLERLKTSYIEKDDAAAQLTCGQVLHAISKQSPDVLKQHAAQALPLAFLAMHTPKPRDAEEHDQKRNEIWEDVWTDLTPGTEATIRLYLEEIVELVKIALQSQNWSMKTQGAAAISTVAKKLDSSFAFPQLEPLLDTVVGMLAGRTWEGKEHLLRAVADICVNFRDEIIGSVGGNSAKVNDIIAIMLKECAKENILYKKEAFKCTANIIHAYKEDAFKEMFQLVKSVIKNDENGDHDSDGEENSKRASPAKIELQEIAFEAVGKSWPNKLETQEQFYLEFCEFLCSSYDNHVLKVQIQILKAMNHFIDRFYLLETTNSEVDDPKIEEVILKVVPRLCVSAENVKSSAIRIEIFDIFYILTSKLKAKGKLGLLTAEHLDQIQNVTTRITKESQTELREKGNNLLHLLTD